VTRTTMRRRVSYRRAVAVAACVAVAGFAASAGVASAAPAPAKITVTFGSCSGGGSEFCFNPESAFTAVGGQAMWTNQSGVGHTATSCTSSACPGAPASTGTNTFNVTLSGSGTGSFTFSGGGIYYYYCTIHGYAAMHGKITVFNPPRISGFTPKSGAPGTTVTITGTHLDHLIKVTFNGSKGSVVTDSQTKITVKVPTGATTGRIAVVTRGGTSTTSTNFTVT